MCLCSVGRELIKVIVNIYIYMYVYIYIYIYYKNGGSVCFFQTEWSSKNSLQLKKRVASHGLKHSPSPSFFASPIVCLISKGKKHRQAAHPGGGGGTGYREILENATSVPPPPFIWHDRPYPPSNDSKASINDSDTTLRPGEHLPHLIRKNVSQVQRFSYMFPAK